MPDINIGGDTVTAITIDGDAVTEVTMDGDVVWQASAVTVLEDWEHGDEPENAGWGGAGTSGFDNQADATLEGSRNLVNTSSGTSMSHATNNTTQGPEYRIRFWFPSGSSFIYFAIHAPTSDSGGGTPNSYQLLANGGASNWHIFESDGSSTRTTLAEDTGQSFTDQTEYQMGIKHRNDGDVEAWLYDGSGTQLNHLGPATPAAQFGPGATWIYHSATGTLTDDIREI